MNEDILLCLNPFMKPTFHGMDGITDCCIVGNVCACTRAWGRNEPGVGGKEELSSLSEPVWRRVESKTTRKRNGDAIIWVSWTGRNTRGSTGEVM